MKAAQECQAYDADTYQAFVDQMVDENRTRCGFTDEQQDLLKNTLRFFVNSSCTYNETFARDLGDPVMTLTWG